VSRSSIVPLGLASVLFLGLGIFVARNLALSTGIAHLLPESRDQELARVSSGLVDSPVTRTMVLAIRGPDLDTAMLAARRWAPSLEAHSEVASLRTGPGTTTAESVFELYFPRRFLFLSTRPERELPERLSDAGLERAAGRLLHALAAPRGPLIREVAAADPLLAFPDLVTRLEDLRQGAPEVIRGQFVDPETNTAIAFLTTRHSAFDAAHQRPFEAFLVKSFEALRQDISPDLMLQRSGVHRFAVASEQEARRDMQRISTVSLAGIVLLFLTVFRSAWLLLVSLVPLLGGVLTATAFGIAAFGPLHVLTLAFGTTLIGVCIDYPIHYVCHHTIAPAAEGPRGSMNRVWGALAMGALTTVAGFVGLAWSDFPGVREIGLFAAAGILGALLTTRFVLPLLLYASPVPSRLQVRLARSLAGWLERMERHRGALWAVLAVVVLTICLGLPRLAIQDDVFALGMARPEAWLEEDAHVRAQVTQMDPGRFVIALGDDDESALQENDTVYALLEAAQQAGELEGFRSLHSALFSADLQMRNLAAVEAQPALAERTLAALEEAGFHSEAFQPFAQDLGEPVPAPLSHADLAASPLADVLAGFRVEAGGRVALLTQLRGVSEPEALAARFAELDDVHYFDQQRFLRGIYGAYRSRTVALIGLGLLAVAALLYLRYRRLRPTLATILPAVLAAALTLAVLALLGIAVNLLHLLGLLLVLSIGVDYAIFLVTSEAHTRGREAAMLSLVVACLSTCLAFGLLAASSFPALRALGTTTGLGVLLSLALAPATFVLFAPKESAKT